MVEPRSDRHRSSTQRTAWVETYGCQMNISDGELMEGVLVAAGFSIAASAEDADVILVNTCAIREHAERRVIGRVGELNRIKLDRPDVVIGVTGCMAQRMGGELLERAPYVDLVMGPDGYRGLGEVLARVRPDWRVGGRARSSAGGASGETGEAAGGDAWSAKGDTAAIAPPSSPAIAKRSMLPVLGADVGEADDVGAATGALEGLAPDQPRIGPERVAMLDFSPEENYEGLAVRRLSGISAWVPIQRGCDHRCTYCIVPYVRGPEKNRDPARVVDEVRGVAARGITEVVLLGQTVNSWEHGDWRFDRLLREVARVDGIRRVRFTSPHPNDVTPELVEVMATEPAVCGQLHLPVQAGHDRTLRRMLRRYTVASYLEKVRLVRDAIPDIALSTDVIVAFPGETEEEFQATLALMREVRFDDAFLYKYSLRAGTPATRLPDGDFLPSDEAQDRLLRIIDMQRAIQADINRSEVGRTVEVLIEREAKSPGDLLGRTEAWKVAAFPGDPALIGGYATVQLVSTTGATFRAELVEAEALATAS